MMFSLFNNCKEFIFLSLSNNNSLLQQFPIYIINNILYKFKIEFIFVPTARLELATSGLEVLRAIQLRHAGKLYI